jgi:hypothetical protein
MDLPLHYSLYLLHELSFYDRYILFSGLLLSLFYIFSDIEKVSFTLVFG